MRICGICKRCPRENDSMAQPIRLTAADVAGHLDAVGKPIAPGLCQCCQDCHDKYKPIIHARLLKDPPCDGQGRKWADETQTVPAVKIPPLEQFGGQWLM